MNANFLLKEGGLAGHMSHLYENPDLTFAKIKEIFQNAVEGNLEGTEKLDGQNIYISYSAKDGKARAVRNKGQIKSGGLDAAGLAAAFQGRDTLETAFNEAFESFENAAKSFSADDVVAIFGEDANIFYNSEIMDPRNANVIQYNSAALVIHTTGHAHIDKETGKISEVKVIGNANALKNALKQYQSTVGQQKFKVQINAVENLQKLASDAAAKEASAALDSETSKYGLSDSSKIGEYLVTKINQVIEENIPDLPLENKKLLAKRMVGLDSVSITQVKKGLAPEQKKYLEAFIPSGQASDKIIGNFKKQAIGPIELIIHQFTVEALKGMHSAFVLDQSAEVGRVKNLVAKAIETIQSEIVKQHYPQALDALEVQLKKLGGVENISTAAEGFVFAVDDQVYKFTGNFAPVNQILGLLKYGRGDVAPIERLVQVVEDIELGKRENVFYMSAVGFKPPHKGHIEMIKKAAEKAGSQNTNFTIFTGRKPRGEITLDQSLKILKLFLEDADVKFGDGAGNVRIESAAASNPTGQTYKDTAANRKSGKVGKTVHTTSPMQPLFNAIVDLPENSTVFIVSSTDDPGRGAKMRKSLYARRPDIELFDYAVDITPAVEGEGKLSATDMRKAIAENDFENFKRFIPDESLGKAELIWTEILGKRKTSQVSETKKKGVGTINHDILSSMISMQLRENKKFQELVELDDVEGEPDWRDPMNYVGEDDENEETVEEISAMGRGAAEMGAGHDNKRDKEDTIIREIYDYLVSEMIIREL